MRHLTGIGIAAGIGISKKNSGIAIGNGIGGKKLAGIGIGIGNGKKNLQESALASQIPESVGIGRN